MIYSKVVIIFLLFVGCRDNHETGFYQDQADNPELKWLSAKDSAGVNIDITQALQDWRNDSLGCLNKRLIASDQGLFRVVKLNNLEHDRVVELLGNPNHIRNEKGYISGDDYFEEDIIILTYTLSSTCTTTDGRISSEPVSWLDISISRKTNRVVRVLGGVT